MNSTLSIILVCHNDEAHVEMVAESLINYDAQIILVDDGSTDKTRNILEKCADRHDRVRLLLNKYYEGTAICCNRAIAELPSDYIALQKGSDTSLYLRFDMQRSYLEEHPSVALIGTHLHKTDMHGTITGSITYPPSTIDDMFKCIVQSETSPVLEQTIMFRRKTIRDVGGFRSSHSLCTFDLVCRLLSAGIGVTNIQKCLVFSHIFPTTKEQREDTEREAAEIIAQFKRRSYPPLSLDEAYFQQECFFEHAYNIERE